MIQIDCLHSLGNAIIQQGIGFAEEPSRGWREVDWYSGNPSLLDCGGRQLPCLIFLCGF